jgi:hypothetical protein
LSPELAAQLVMISMVCMDLWFSCDTSAVNLW